MYRIHSLFFVLALLLPSAVLAQQTEPTPKTIPYQGTLELNGQALHGPYDFRVGLFPVNDASTACLAQEPVPDDCGVWSQEFAAVQVFAGRFSLSVGPLTANVIQRENLFLGIAIRSAEDGSYVALANLQKILAAPYAVRSDFGVVPVGSITAWHPNLLPGNAALPPEWVRCDGQTLADPDSPLNGVQIPDLNNQRRFLRGDATSGGVEEDQLQSHTHTDEGHTHGYQTRIWFNNEYRSGGNYYSGRDQTGNALRNNTSSSSSANLTNPTESSAGAIRHGAETRPKNMSVVWIMRVK